jgi:hypothetical protein
MFSFPAPTAKSNTRFQAREIEGEIQYQLQTENSFGSFNEGSMKYWLLAARVLELPVRNALTVPAPNGPEYWMVGTDVEVVRSPVMAVTSFRNPSGLKG